MCAYTEKEGIMMKEQTAASGRFFTAPVLTLMALGFVLGSCEYVVVAILPDIARGLNVSLGAAGKLVGVFAAGYAIGTPIVTAATGRLPRFRLLTVLMALFLAANLLSMLAPNLWVLCASRALAAVLTGTLTAVSPSALQKPTDDKRGEWAMRMLMKAAAMMLCLMIWAAPSCAQAVTFTDALG